MMSFYGVVAIFAVLLCTLAISTVGLELGYINLAGLSYYNAIRSLSYSGFS
jgi:hypothetical protein